MTSIDDLLERDEHVVHATKTSWIAPLLATRTGTLLVVGGGLALIAGPLVERAALVLTGAHLETPGQLGVLLRITALLAISFGATLLVQAFTERWLQDCYVTNRRVMTLQRHASSTPAAPQEHDPGEGGSAEVAWVWLETIRDVGVDQALLGIWLDFGTVELLPGNPDAEAIRLRRIRRPAELRAAIRDQLPPSA